MKNKKLISVIAITLCLMIAVGAFLMPAKAVSLTLNADETIYSDSSIVNNEDGTKTVTLNAFEYQDNINNYDDINILIYFDMTASMDAKNKLENARAAVSNFLANIVQEMKGGNSFPNTKLTFKTFANDITPLSIIYGGKTYTEYSLEKDSAGVNISVLQSLQNKVSTMKDTKNVGWVGNNQAGCLEDAYNIAKNSPTTYCPTFLITDGNPGIDVFMETNFDEDAGNLGITNANKLKALDNADLWVFGLSSGWFDNFTSQNFVYSSQEKILNYIKDETKVCKLGYIWLNVISSNWKDCDLVLGSEVSGNIIKSGSFGTLNESVKSRNSSYFQLIDGNTGSYNTITNSLLELANKSSTRANDFSMQSIINDDYFELDTTKGLIYTLIPASGISLNADGTKRSFAFNENAKKTETLDVEEYYDEKTHTITFDEYSFFDNPVTRKSKGYSGNLVRIQYTLKPRDGFVGGNDVPTCTNALNTNGQLTNKEELKSNVGLIPIGIESANAYVYFGMEYDKATLSTKSRAWRYTYYGRESGLKYSIRENVCFNDLGMGEPHSIDFITLSPISIEDKTEIITQNTTRTMSGSYTFNGVTTPVTGTLTVKTVEPQFIFNHASIKNENMTGEASNYCSYKWPNINCLGTKPEITIYKEAGSKESGGTHGDYIPLKFTYSVGTNPDRYVANIYSQNDCDICHNEVPDTAQYQSAAHISSTTAFIYNYELNGGTGWDGGESNKLYANTGAEADLTFTAEKEGYTFVGWNTNPNAHTGLESVEMGDADIVLYAIYQKDITVNFRYFSEDMKENLKSSETKSIFNNESEVMFSEPENICKVLFPEQPILFEGWVIDSDKKYDINNMWDDVITDNTFWLNNSTDFNAIYSSYSIAEFDTNGGRESYDDIEQPYTITVTEDNDEYRSHCGESEFPDDPTREGYTFREWAYEPVDYLIVNGNKFSLGYVNTKFTAQWDINQYTITFNTNGGTEIPSITQDYNTDIVTPVNPTKEGYTFNGWDIEIPQKMPAKNMIISAKWVANEYTYKFESNGGTPVADITAVYNAEITAPENPMKTGYTFIDWFEDEELENDYTIPEKMPDLGENNAVKTLYAGWAANEYTITFNSMGGSEVAPIKANYDTEIIAPANPVMTGYTFEGWYEDAEHKTPYTIPQKMPAENKTVYAKWKINSYNAIFYMNDGTDDEFKRVSVNYNDDIIMTDKPSRIGYSFIGWNIDKLASKGIDLGKMPNDNKIFYAVWKVNEYTITFDTDGGTSINPITQDYNTDVVKPENPTKVGYTFDSWTPEIPDKMPDSDITVKALWNINQYTITFDTKGGTPVDPIKQNYNTDVVKPENPAKVGYTFNGWDVEIPAKMPADNITITAKWTANKYNVNWHVEDVVTSTPVEYNSVITPAEDPVKNGYTFTGWNPAIPEKMPANDIDLYAQFIANNYPARFHLNYGTDTVFETIQIAYDSDVTSPEKDPSRKGYEFVGWAKSNTATAKDESLGIMNSTEGLDFYAVWVPGNSEYHEVIMTMDTAGIYQKTSDTKKTGTTDSIATLEYTPGEGFFIDGTHENTLKSGKITADDSLILKIWVARNKNDLIYKLNGGTYNSSTDDVKYSVYYDDNTPSLTPIKVGYTFDGWDVIIPDKMPNKAIIATAKWKIKSHTMTFDTKGGSAIDPLTLNYGAKVPEINAPRKEGYTFDGWNKSLPDTMPDEDLTFEAQWKVNQYTITFDTDGGSPIAPITQNFGSEVVSPENPTKTGYTFDGWAPEVPAKMPATDTTVKAQWKVNQYTITFDTKGGTSITPIIQDYNTDIVKPENPTKVGYTFNGWDIEIPQKMPAENKKITAKWTVNQYNVNWHVGDVVTSTPVEYDSIITPAKDPVKTGYAFAGWNPAIPEKMPANDVDLYAQFIADNYPARFHTNYGTDTVFETIQIAYDSAVTSPEKDPSRKGYEFVGWAKSNTATAKDESLGIMNDVEGLDFYAVWTPGISEYHEVIMTMDTEGVYQQTSDTKKTGTTDSTATLVYMTEEGFFIDNNHEDTLRSGKINADGSLVLKIWVARNKNDLIYKLNGGTYDSSTDDIKYSIYYNDNTPSLTPIKVGYTFDGWDVVIPDKMPNKAITATAKWKINSYTITFDTKGGSIIDPITLNYGAQVPEIKAPVKEGYTFNGWNKALPDTMPDEDLIFEAQWKVNQYTITFDTDGGSPVAPITQDFGSEVIDPGNPTKEGYTFKEWDTEIPEIMPSHDTDIKAVWTENSYIISFNANGGEGNMDDIAATYTESVVLSENKFTNDAAFAGWNTKADGTGTHYNDKATVSKLAAENNTKVTLYAQWVEFEKTSSVAGDAKPGKVITYNITLGIPESSSCVTITDAIPEGTIYNNDASNGGAYKDGVITWSFNDCQAGDKLQVSFSVTIAKHIDNSEFAVGEKITNTANALIDNVKYSSSTASNTIQYYKVKYNANGAKGNVPVDNRYYSAGEKTSVMNRETLSMNNKKFAGWNTKSDGTGVHYDENANIEINKNIELFAQWFYGLKTAKTGDAVKPGDIIDYEITVVPAESGQTLILTDIIPEGTTYIKDSSTATFENNALKWIVETEANKTYVFKFSVTVDNVAPKTEIANIAKAVINGYEFNIGSNPIGDDPTVVFVDDYFNIKYVADGAIGDIPIDSTNYLKDNIAKVKESNLIKDGFKFAGWNTSEDGTGVHYNDGEEIKINENLTLYAQWFDGIKSAAPVADTLKPDDQIEYTITVKATENASEMIITDAIPELTAFVSSDDGVFENGVVKWIDKDIKAGQIVVHKFIVKINSDAASNAAIANKAYALLNGHSFIIGNDKESDDPVIVHVDTYYKVSYNANGAKGNVPVDNNNYLKNETVTVKENTLDNGNKTFAGWNTKADGTGIHYNANESFSVDENIVLYAQWVDFAKESTVTSVRPGEEIVYTISITIPEPADNIIVQDELPAEVLYEGDDMVNGVVTRTFNDVQAGTTITTEIVATIKDVEDGTTIMNTAKAYVDNAEYTSTTTSDKVGYFTVKYISDVDAANVPVDTKFYKNGDITKVLNKGNLNNTGYSFAGWLNAGNGVIYQENAELTVTGNTTLKAIWVKASKAADVKELIVPGTIIPYEITVEVTETSDLTVTDVLPAGLELTSYTEVSFAQCKAENNAVTWTASNVKAGTYKFNLAARVMSNAEGIVSNTASVNCNGYKISTNSVDTNISYSVTYISGEQRFTDEKKYSFNDKATILDGSKVVKNGYCFIGWNTSEDGTGIQYKVNDILTVNGDINLYAMYVKANKTIKDAKDAYKPGDVISFEITAAAPYNGATLAIIDMLPLSLEFESFGTSVSNAIADGQTITVIFPSVEANKEYKVIINCVVKTEAKKEVISNTAEVLIDNISYKTDTASATVNYAKITYNSNGAQGETPIDKNVYDINSKAIVMSGETLKMSGYKFKGWNTKADGTGTQYTAKSEISVNDDITLYAIFEKNSIIGVPDTGSETPVLSMLTLAVAAGAVVVLKKKKED